MEDLSASRRAPTWLLVVVLVLLYPWSMGVNLWFAAPENRYYEPLLRASNGLLWPNLQACLPTIAIWLVIFRFGGLRLADIGWRRRDLAAGALATLLIWGICNLVALVVNFADIRLASDVAQAPTYAAGHLLGQVLGNALYEETLYRGFCLVQFLLILLARGFRPIHAAGLAALGSAIVFALPHIPNRMLKGGYPELTDLLGDQVRLLFSGLFLAWVYIRTRNLWWAVGLHSLANYPAQLIEWGSKGAAKSTIAVLGLLVTIAWPWLFGNRASSAHAADS